MKPMNEATANIVLDGMLFSRAKVIDFDGSREELTFLLTICKALGKHGKIGLYPDNKFAAYLRESSGEELESVLLSDSDIRDDGQAEAMPCDAIFICELRWLDILKAERRLKHLDRKLISISSVIDSLDIKDIPGKAWTPSLLEQSIYPIELPEIEFAPNLDMILLDLPARSIAQMPAGFAYVHNALKRTGIKFQTLDYDIIVYHRFHMHRLLDGAFEICGANAHKLPEDPWQPVHYLEWENPDFLAYFENDLEELASKIIEARPKILGVSLQQANLSFARKLIARLKAAYPEIIVVVGGMSCLQPGAGKVVMSEADYIVIGEADLTIGPLVKELMAGEKPADRPGIWSKGDSPDRVFTPGPIPEDLNELEFPKYEWTDLSLYRNWNGYQLTPVIGSRGCHWARCRFCAERFRWRTKSAEHIVDELEYLYGKGLTNFVFNESDLHGDPGITERMCDEIIRRGLKITMSAQLRCNIKTGPEYYLKLREAGFGCLRFGVDGGSTNTLKLERKGYSKSMILNNLKDSHAAGIANEINLVVGIPGETEEDIDETIAFLTEIKPFIWRLAFINPLMLFRGSDYWEEPEKYGIKFRVDRQELQRKYLVAVPDDTWYSENPFIDREIRYARMQRIVLAMRKIGMQMGDFAEFVINRASEKSATPDKLNILGNKGLPAPALVKPDYKGFNIVRYGGKYYALSLSLGKLDLPCLGEKELEGDGKLILSSDSLEEAKASIDNLYEETEYKGFKIFNSLSKCYISKTGIKSLQHQGFLTFISLSEAKEFIDFLLGRPDIQVHGKTWNNFILMEIGINHLAIHEAFKDFHGDDCKAILKEFGLLIEGDSVEALRSSALSKGDVSGFNIALCKFAIEAKMLGWRKIALFGAGQHTRRILPELEKRRKSLGEITCFIDDNPRARTIPGRKVISPGDADHSGFDVILISSDAYEEALFARTLEWRGQSPVYALYSGKRA